MLQNQNVGPVFFMQVWVTNHIFFWPRTTERADLSDFIFLLLDVALYSSFLNAIA